ncbi:hypothetical protein C8035_v007862 [Colletotrichum spinosum]|uniref:Amidoligase enzyme n=1 Tax=Colletotrichum spinosum TaxID=1347390 RepID=A0A4R8QF37_9PEZI|nr:hypothetical protein C8035_v007862 [Colletotrichum spinosum]
MSSPTVDEVELQLSPVLSLTDFESSDITSNEDYMNDPELESDFGSFSNGSEIGKDEATESGNPNTTVDDEYDDEAQREDWKVQDAQPGPVELLFSVDICFLAETSGVAGAALTREHPDYVKPRETPIDGLTSRYLEFNIVKSLRAAQIFATSESQDVETRELLEDHLLLTLGMDPESHERSYYGHGPWRVLSGDEHHQGDQSWQTVHLNSPLMELCPDSFGKIDTAISCLRDSPDISIALHHKSRLQVSLQPVVEEFGVRELQKIVPFLLVASPLVDKLHAEYLGANSAITPGLKFAPIFNDLHYTRAGEWAQEETAEAVFTGGLPAACTAPMIKGPKPHSPELLELKLLEFSMTEELKEVVDSLGIFARDARGRKYRLAGAYDFSELLSYTPSARVVSLNQHAATLDTVAIANWVKVCHGMFSFCLNAPRSDYQRVIDLMKRSADTSSDTYSVYNLLEDLDLAGEAEYYTNLGPNPFAPDVEPHRVTAAIDLSDTPGVRPYTFGVEFEFILPYSLSGTDIPHPEDTRWHYQDTPRSSRSSSPPPLGSTPEPMAAADSEVDVVQEALAVLDLTLNSDTGIETGEDAFAKAKGHFCITPDCLAYTPEEMMPKMREAGFNLVFDEDILLDYQVWQTKSDCSLTSFHEGCKGYSGGVCGLELTSPILRPRERDYARIRDVIRTVRNKTRAMMDKSCGLHVHVGNVRNFSMRALQRIATLVYLADPILASLVHPQRSDSYYSKALQKGSALSAMEELPSYQAWMILRNEGELLRELEAHVPMNLLFPRLQEEVIVIWSTKDLARMIDLFRSEGAGRISFDLGPIRSRRGMDEADEAAGPMELVFSGTMEFRGMDGTLDPELVTRWVRLVVAMVEKGDASTPLEYFNVVRDMVKWHETNEDQLRSFLGALGLAEDADFWAGVAQINVNLPDVPPLARSVLRAAETEEKQRDWCNRYIASLPELP